MNELLLYRIAAAVGGILLLVISGWTLRLSPGNLARFEPWPRNRLGGLLLGWVALGLCVSHAQVVSPGFLLPLLWPLAVIVPVLSYFFLDYLLARAVGGSMILWAYYLVHESFNVHAAGTPVLALLAWIFGFGGIWVSGRPCALRDWIRLCCGNPRWRWASAGFLILLAAAMLAAAALTGGR